MSVHYTEGIDIGSNLEGEVRLSKEMLRGNLLIAGRSGAGKTHTLLHIVQELLLQQEANDSLVLIDSHSDLTRQLLPRIPEPLTDRVRLVELGNNRVPLLNPLDPRIFPNPEVLTRAVHDASKNWGSRVDDILNHCLRALCSFNSHPETKADETLTMLELPRLWNRQAGILAELSAFQQYVLSRDADPENERWFRRIAQWPLDLAVESVEPLNAWMEQLTRDPWTPGYLRTKPDRNRPVRDSRSRSDSVDLPWLGQDGKFGRLFLQLTLRVDVRRGPPEALLPARVGPRLVLHRR